MQNGLLTGPESAELAGVDPCTIRQWKRRGLIRPAGLDDHGRPLYTQLAIAEAEYKTRAKAGRTPGQRRAKAAAA